MNKKQFSGKRVLTIMALLLFVILAWNEKSVPVQAESGTITFSTASQQVKKGAKVVVVCQIITASEFMDAEFVIDYDSEYLQFVKGGSKVRASGSTLVVSSTGNTTATTKKTFALEFVALKKGTTDLSLSSTASVTDADGNAFSISSNRLTLQIVKKTAVQKTAPPKVTQAPVVTPAPVLSNKNKLVSLKTTALSITPVFDPDTTEYNATVDSNTDILYTSYQTEQEKAIVTVTGNEDLQTGNNEVKIQVTAENGEQKLYRIQVKKETKEETEQREKKQNEAKDTADISFSIRKNNDKILLSNQYEFEVLDPSGAENVPAGYVLSNIELEGITVPAYTIENDLDGNYLLLYLKGPSGKPYLYQYDRQEKTLQRYTGSMTEKVNRGTTEQRGAVNFNNYVMVVILIVLVVVILVLLIAMLKMAIRRKEEKNKGDYLDF